MPILLPDDPLTLSVLKAALVGYAEMLNLDQVQSDRTDAPQAPEYGTAIQLWAAVMSHEPTVEFGEYAPLDCEVGDGEIVDRDRAILLPNFGYAHDSECASQWHVMEENK